MIDGDEELIRWRSISQHSFIIYCSTLKERGCLCVLMESAAVVAVRGKLRVFCVNGVAQVMGYELNAARAQNEQEMFSPNSHSLLTLQVRFYVHTVPVFQQVSLGRTADSHDRR